MFPSKMTFDMQPPSQILQQQQTLHLSNLVQAFTDSSIKNLQAHNKNKMQRQLLDIATNFCTMMQKIQMLKWFCVDYKATLEKYRDEEKVRERQRIKKQQLEDAEDDLKEFDQVQKMIDENMQNTIPVFFQNQLSLNSQPSGNNPLQPQQQQPIPKAQPFIVLPSMNLQIHKQQLQQIINKLKVMITKVNTRESTQIEHVYSSYVSRLKYTLDNSNLNEKHFKMNRIRNLLEYVKRKYLTIKLEGKNIYPCHLTRYPEIVAMQYPDELPMFFINFYSQQLLFFNNLKIKLKPGIQQLLFCPITLVKGKYDQSLKISKWYYNLLTLIQPSWRSTLLLVKIYNKATSLTHPIYYSHMSLKKFQFPPQLKARLDQNNENFNFMEHKLTNQEELLEDIQSVKSFLYQYLVFGHLVRVLDKNFSGEQQNDDTKVEIDVEGGFRVVFELVSDLTTKETLKNVYCKMMDPEHTAKLLKQIFAPSSSATQTFPAPQYRSQFFIDLLLFYKRKNLFTQRRSTLQQEIKILFKTTLFKLITEDMDYRTINPAYSGSMGLYYYEKRTIRKCVTKDFLENFGKQ